MIRRFLRIAVDFIAAALVIAAVWMIDYQFPQDGIQAIALQKTVENPKTEGDD